MKYILKKTITLIITMILVSFLTFAAFSLISGDPATAMLGTEATPERLELLREEMGITRPFIVRYASWLKGFFTGDLGISYSYNQPVWELISPKLSVSFCLAVFSFILILVISIPAGIISSGRKNGIVTTAVNQLCMSIPPFFTGILLTWIFSVCLKWFVHGSFPGLDVNFAGSLKYMLFAAVSLAIPRIAMTSRMLRSTIVGEMQKGYVITSVSRGAGQRKILFSHVLRNSLVPTVTILAQTMSEIVAGSIVVEQVFAIPGLGRLLVASISNRDYPVVEAIIVILAFWVVLVNIIADIINMRIDPRLRLGGRP